MSFKLYNEPQYFIVHTNTTTLQILETSSPSYINEFVSFNLSGINYTTKRTYLDVGKLADLESHDFGEIANGSGEWFAAAKRTTQSGTEYLFFSDRYGYCPIFYSFTPNKHIIISDSFYGVIAGMESMNIPRTLNVGHYASAIGSNSPAFQNNHASSTMANEVHVLSQDHAILIGNKQVKLIDRESVGGVDKIVSYTNALDAGIKQATTVLKQVSEATDLDRRITLSGGVDSRLCAALLLSSGSLPNFRVSTIDPRVWGQRSGIETITKDMAISDRIRDDQKLSWWHMSDRLKVSQSFMESLVCFQSYRSNMAYTFRPSPTHTRFRNAVLTVRGGGGEIIRTDATVEKMAKEYSAESANTIGQISDDAEWYAGRVLRHSLLDGDIGELARKTIIDAFPVTAEASFVEKISQLYLNYRYRGHFGHQRQTSSTNDLIIHPLSNSFLLKAANIVTFEERQSGRIVRDLFQATAPELLQYPLESENWTALLGAGGTRPVDFHSSSWQHALDASRTASAVTFDVGREAGHRLEAFDFDAQQSCINYLRQGLPVLEDLVDSGYLKEFKELNQRVFSRVQSSRFTAGHVVAKVASALDVFFPQIATGTREHLWCGQEPGAKRSTPVVSVNHPAIPQDGFHCRPVNEFTLTLESTLTEVEVLVTAKGYVESVVEYAFYLYKNSERIETRWYSHLPCVTFHLNDQDEKYAVECFTRTKHDSRIVSIIRTEVNIQS